MIQNRRTVTAAAALQKTDYKTSASFRGVQERHKNSWSRATFADIPIRKDDTMMMSNLNKVSRLQIAVSGDPL